MNSLQNYLKSIKNKRVAVVGAGISNTPLIELLLTAGIDTTVCDKQTREELGETAGKFEKAGAKLRLGDDYLENLKEDIIFSTPGLMPANPALKEAVARGSILTSEMEVFFDVCPCKIIAITGSDGKTTTTSIIAEILKNDGKTVHIGGNIGNPLLSNAGNMKPDDYAVIELSSFQLITMQKSPDIAVVTNMSPNHLDIHSNMEEYIKAKGNIFLHQQQSNRAVFNLDNNITRDYAKDASAGEVLFFSRLVKVETGVYLHKGIIYDSKSGIETEIMSASDIILPGVHNIENYLSAFAALSGVASRDSMIKTAKTFSGVQHRLELVRELHGVKYYNDSIASSPSRAIAGLKAFTETGDDESLKGKRNVILIAGGKDKGIAFDEFGDEVAKGVKTVVLTGKTADMIRLAVENSSFYDCNGSPDSPAIMQSSDFEEAVHLASKTAKEGDIVLLSPACTSFDMFKNFEHRGNEFKNIIKRLV